MSLLVGLVAGCGGGNSGPGPSDVVRSDTGPTEIILANGDSGLLAATGNGTGQHKIALPANVGFDMAGFSLGGHLLARQDIDGGSNTWRGLQVSDANATNSRLVWKFGDQFYTPTWNRTGTMIAVVLDPNMTPEGTPACPCIPSGLWTLRPGGSGTHLVLATHEPADGGSSRDSIGQTVAWSPDGRRLAFVTARHVETIAVTGGGPPPSGATLIPSRTGRTRPSRGPPTVEMCSSMTPITPRHRPGSGPTRNSTSSPSTVVPSASRCR